jgi:hypothetical protein
MLAEPTRALGCILLTLFASGIIGSRLPAAEALLPDGRRVPGTLRYQPNGRLRFQPRGQEKALSLDLVEQLRFESKPADVSPKAESQTLLLRGGERLGGAFLSFEGDKVRWRTGWGQPFALARSEVAGVVQNQRPTARGQTLPRPPGDLTQDEVWLRSGDQLFGEAVRADGNGCVLKNRFAERTFSWADARGLFFRQQSGSPFRTEEGEQVRLVLENLPPDELEGVVRAYDEKTLRLRHAVLGDVLIPTERMRRLEGIVYGQRIHLDQGIHHLGRQVLSTLELPQPEGLVFRRAFPFADSPGNARLSLTVSHLQGTGDGIAAELARGALRTEVVLNGKVVDYLNRHVDRLAGRPRRLTIALPRHLLRRGENGLELRQTVDPTTGHCEDCVFSNVVIELPTVP